MLKDSGYYLLGLLLLGLGVNTIYYANIGFASWDAFHMVMSQVTPLSIGTIIIIEGIIILIIIKLITRSKFKWLALLASFIAGFSVDFWAVIFNYFPAIQTLLPQIFTFFLGLFILGSGIALYIAPTRFSANPIDSIMVTCHEYYKLSIFNSKLITELIALSGTVLICILFSIDVLSLIGIGTIISIPLLGIIVQTMNQFFTKHLKIK